MAYDPWGTMGSHWRKIKPGPVTGAIALCCGYYLGANLGFILRFPPTTPSVLWPPNAILTAALLLNPPRRWWIYLLAAIPAHLAAEVGTFPMPLVIAFYVTNCLEALIAAAAVHAFSDAPVRFDSLRRINVFIVSALLSPFLTSFVDAWAVNAILDESYWQVWRIRLLSNMLTELTVVPALVMAINMRSSPFRSASSLVTVKALSLAMALLGIGGLVFLAPSRYLDAFPGAPVTPLAFLIPFIILSAVKFGPGGASAALLTTTLLAVLAATHHSGPFSSLSPSESVAALQISLIMVAVPVISLAALIDERRRAQHALAERLGFEALVSRFSSAFVHLPAHAIDAALETWLARVGEFFEVDRLLLFRLADDGHDLVLACAWPPSPRSIPAGFSVKSELPWTFVRLMRERPVAFSRVSDLPRDAATDAATFRRHGVVSNVTIPLGVGTALAGSLSFESLRAEREWPEEQIRSLWLVADVFASALARRKVEEALRASEVMKSSILASLSSSVVVLDRQGRVIAVNESWRDFARGHMTWNRGIDTGSNYLDVCRSEAGAGNQPAIEAVVAIEAVLKRAQPASSFEYLAGGAGKECWFAVSVVPLNRPEGGAVLSQTDVTERKYAELEAQRSRGELAHFTRVSTMGELAASLAHELNQPLAGILMSAQAARRFLAMTPPDLKEIDEALADIIDDDKRAGEVIQRMRELLSKGESRRDVLNLNALIDSMAKLLSSDAVMRDLTIRLELDRELPPVRGDRVQLQQVILNLVLNAMEAMNEAGVTRRPVIVRTARRDAGIVVSVSDEGGGLPTGMVELVFEPFYTTKAAGMGMGLAIARSIVRAHGGSIQASNNDARGATFTFTLPADTEAA
jgi:signal transduction histidine kinase